MAEKVNVGKMAIFGLKPWVNPFGNMLIFRLFKRVVFFSLERRFLVLEYRKAHFSGLYCLKLKLGKMSIFQSKQWVNPVLKNLNFSSF